MDRFSVNNNGSTVGGGATSTSGTQVVNSGGSGVSGNNAAASTNNNSTNVANNSNNSAASNNTNNNNGVKLRPDRGGNASIDSTLSSASSSAVSGIASSYRRSFHHRLGPGSASATSDYSMSTVAESIQYRFEPIRHAETIPLAQIQDTYHLAPTIFTAKSTPDRPTDRLACPYPIPITTQQSPNRSFCQCATVGNILVLHYTSAAANRYVSAAQCAKSVNVAAFLLAPPKTQVHRKAACFKARQKQTTVSLMVVVGVVGAGDATIDALQPWKR
ncbi:hypothetical protein RP20_CCG007491 [Aedes albopictus]|nr:hypothetical protein RP20_CCG007491 [Aedes albopictus]